MVRVVSLRDTDGGRAVVGRAGGAGHACAWGLVGGCCSMSSSSDS
jgi:hypothetical protein